MLLDSDGIHRQTRSMNRNLLRKQSRENLSHSNESDKKNTVETAKES